MGDIGAVATLFTEVFSWVTDPTKYQTLSREGKLAKLQEALKTALDNRHMDAADLLYGELRRMSESGG